MPYVKMTKEERQESRRKAIEKANATRANKPKRSEPTSYIRVYRSSLDLLNKMAFEQDKTQLSVVTNVIKEGYGRFVFSRDTELEKAESCLGFTDTKQPTEWRR